MSSSNLVSVALYNLINKDFLSSLVKLPYWSLEILASLYIFAQKRIIFLKKITTKQLVKKMKIS